MVKRGRRRRTAPDELCRWPLHDGFGYGKRLNKLGRSIISTYVAVASSSCLGTENLRRMYVTAHQVSR